LVGYGTNKGERFQLGFSVRLFRVQNQRFCKKMIYFPSSQLILSVPFGYGFSLKIEVKETAEHDYSI
jgi:hypothetical protein